MKEHTYTVTVKHTNAYGATSLYEGLKKAIFDWHANEPAVQTASVLPVDDPESQYDIGYGDGFAAATEKARKGEKCPRCKNEKPKFTICDDCYHKLLIKIDNAIKKSKEK